MKHCNFQQSNKNAVPLTPAAASVHSDTHRRSHAFRRFLQSYRLRAGGTNDGTKAQGSRNSRLQCHNKSSVTADLQTSLSTASSPGIQAGVPAVHCNGIHVAAAASHVLEHASPHLHLTAGTTRGTGRDGSHPRSSYSVHSPPAGHGKAVRCAITVHDCSSSQANIALATHHLPQPPPDPHPQPLPPQPRAPLTPQQIQQRYRTLARNEGPQAAAAMLTTQIPLRTSWADLRDLLVLLGPHLNHIHVVAMLCRLATLARSAPPTPSPGTASSTPSAAPAPTSAAPWPTAPLTGDPAAAPHPDPAAHPALALLIRELAARTHDALPSIDPPGVAGAAAALATLSHYDPALVADIQRRSVPWMASLAPSHLVSLLWAVATFRRRHHHSVGAQWLDTATFCIASRLGSLSATHVARTLHALALLDHRPGPDWLAAFFHALVAAAPAFNPQDLTNSLYALGVLRVPLPAAALPALDARTQQLLPHLQARHLSNVAWAWGRLRHRPPSALRGAFMHRTLLQLGAFGEQHIANLLWGLAAARLPVSKGFQDRCWKAVRTRLLRQQRAAAAAAAAAAASASGSSPGAAEAAAAAPRVDTRAFCSILWSIAVLGYRPTNKWLAAFFQAGTGALHDFPPRALATTVWALGELGYLPNDEWMFDLGRELLVALPRCRPVDLVQLLCGFRALKQDFGYQPDDALLDRMVQAAVARLPAFNASQTAALLAAACVLYQKPSMRAMLAALAHFDRQLPGANAHAVSNAVWALGRLGGRSVDRPVVLGQGELVGRLLAASRASLPRCNSLDLVQQVVGWAALQHHPGPEWLQLHEQQCYRQLVQAAQVAGAGAAAQPALPAGALAGEPAGGRQAEAGQQLTHAGPGPSLPGQRGARGPHQEQAGLEQQQQQQATPQQLHQQQVQAPQQQQPRAEDATGAMQGGICRPGFTTSEARKLASAYRALGHEVQHPVLRRLMHAADYQLHQQQQRRQQQQRHRPRLRQQGGQRQGQGQGQAQAQVPLTPQQRWERQMLLQQLRYRQQQQQQQQQQGPQGGSRRTPQQQQQRPPPLPGGVWWGL